MLKIYGALLSPFVRKVRCVLTEKQVAYELVATNPFDKSGPPPQLFTSSISGSTAPATTTP